LTCRCSRTIRSALAAGRRSATSRTSHARFGRSSFHSDIDIEALRKKYSRPRHELEAEAKAKYGNRGDVLSQQEAKMTEVTMCPQCQAAGTIKKQYGFRVIDEVCPNCDGEGCFVKGRGKKASAELKDKVKAVEALVAECEDLDELEKLEAALTKNSMEALDAVLKEARWKAIHAREAEEAAAATASTDAMSQDSAPPDATAVEVS